MTGLEKILKHIEDDANATAQAVLEESRSKAEDITATAQTDGEKNRAEIEERSKLDVQACLSRAESAALLQEKKLILNAKQEIISSVIKSAKDSLFKLSNVEYTNVIVKMLVKYAMVQQGQIILSANDKLRLGKDFQATIQLALASTEGAAHTVSEDTRDIDGGFVLIYGDVEINCSFDALFFAARESLQDKVCGVLFV